MPGPLPEPINLPCPAEHLVKHRGPMLLIDQLLERTGEKSTASATLRPHNICFSEDRGILPEYFIELVAQTTAAANGYDCLLREIPIKDGFLVGIDDFALKQYLPPRQYDFNVQATTTMDLGNMKVIQGEVQLNDELVATVALRIWQQD